MAKVEQSSIVEQAKILTANVQKTNKRLVNSMRLDLDRKVTVLTGSCEDCRESIEELKKLKQTLPVGKGALKNVTLDPITFVLWKAKHLHNAGLNLVLNSTERVIINRHANEYQKGILTKCQVKF